MMNRNYITAFCKIRSGEVIINNAIAYTNKESVQPVEFLKSAYKFFQFGYPKFYKMDGLSKLGFIASELLLKDNKLTSQYKAEDIAILLSNSASSLEVDTEHQATISDRNNYFPSPAVFVYTLPNILIGEIAVKNSIKGENTFFIFDKFDPGFMSSYINLVLDTNKAQACITGWVDFYENKYDAFLYTVEKKAGVLKMDHSTEEITKLYN